MASLLCRCACLMLMLIPNCQSATTDLSSRIQQLETRLEEFRHTENLYQQEIHLQHEDFLKQSYEISQQMIEITNQRVDIDKQKAQISKQNEEMSLQETDLKALRQDNAQLKIMLDQIRHNQPAFVAFRTIRTTDMGPVSAETNIAYDLVDLNMGGAYDPVSGLFTAPEDGIYHFSLLHRWDNVHITTNINGVVVSRTVNSESSVTSPTGGHSLTVQLTAGDVVGNVLSIGGSSSATLDCNYQEARSCEFSGFLVYQSI